MKHAKEFSMLINVDFKLRQVVSRPLEPLDLPEQPDPNDLFAMYDQAIERITNRFGDHQPRGGVVYKSSPTVEGFDVYGRGCVHNSIHQYMPTKHALQFWNRPMPFPCDLRAIDKFLCDFSHENKGKTLKVGLKSDPFMWMDQKYSITKSVLKLANKYNVQLELHTMSDLCGHDDYAELLEAGGHSIVMHMGFEHLKFQDSHDLDRNTCPGAPSKIRRQQAIDKLKSAGVRVRTEYTDLRDLIKDPTKLQRLCRATGTGPDYWTGADALTTAGVQGGAQ